MFQGQGGGNIIPDTVASCCNRTIWIRTKIWFTWQNVFLQNYKTYLSNFQNVFVLLSNNLDLDKDMFHKIIWMFHRTGVTKQFGFGQRYVSHYNLDKFYRIRFTKYVSQNRFHKILFTEHLDKDMFHRRCLRHFALEAIARI